MALLSLQAFKTKWAAITGRFKDNNTFDIAEKDYREFSTDIADSLFEPVESLRARVEKLEQPAPPAPEGIKWVRHPKVSVVGEDVLITLSEADFNGAPVEFQPGTAKENVPLPPVGWGERIDILAATATGWVYIYGQDPGVTPAFVHPDQPETELLFAAYLFWSNAGGAVEEPVVFVKVLELNGQEYAPDASGRLVLPEIKGGGGAETVEVNLGNRTTNYLLKFDKKYIVTANINASIQITADIVGLKPGTPSLLNLNCAAGFVPVMQAPFVKKAGDFAAGTRNYVECLPLSNTEIHYEIYQ